MPLAPGPGSAAARPDRGRGGAGRRRSAELPEGGLTRHSRRARRDDLPGSDDVAEPLYVGRGAADGTAADPPEDRPRGGGSHGTTGTAGSRRPGGGAADPKLSTPVLRRHASTRDDCHGA